MGVLGLQSYVEKRCSPGAFYPVDIKKLADIHRQSYNKRKNKEKVTMIIDLQSCVSSVYDGLDLICEGQFKEYSDRWQMFLTALSEAQILPVFVSDGGIPPSKRPTWVKRRYASLREFVYPVLDSLKQNMKPDLSCAHSKILPALESESILTVALDEELELINSTSQQDADQLIVQLAIKRNAFAIFAQDTDYLIYQYPNHIHYLSAAHFHWKDLFNGSKDLHTKKYDRAGLCHCLSLSMNQLPLLATLKGNDIVSNEDLENFHRWLTRKERGAINHHEVIKALANLFIQEHFPVGEAVYPKIREITHFTFYGDLSKEELVEKSLRNYFLNNTDFQSQSSNKECQWLALVEMQNPGSKLRTVMEGGSTESSTRLEEYRISSDYPPPLKLFLSNLYRRLWGVLLVEKPNALEKDQSKFAIHVEEWHMTGIGSLDRPNFSKPIVPPNNVYSVGLLSQMWTLKKEKDGNELHQKRWKLFSYIISPLLNSEALQRFENKMFLICQLFVFQHEDEVIGPLLYGWEIRVLIVLHFLMKRITGQY